MRQLEICEVAIITTWCYFASHTRVYENFAIFLEKTSTTDFKELKRRVGGDVRAKRYRIYFEFEQSECLG